MQSLMEKLSLKNKKGQIMNNIFVAVFAGILLIVAIYLFTTLGSTFTAGSAAANATSSLTTQYGNQTGLAGLLIVAALIGGVIVFLVAAFFGRGSRA